MAYSTSRAYDGDRPVVWWDKATKNPEDDECSVHRLLFPHVQALEEDQSDIHLMHLLNARLYSNRELMAFEWDSTISANFRPLSSNMENLVQSSCDTMHSRLAVARPKAKVMTRGAGFNTYRKARLLDRYTWGEFQYHNIWDLAERAWIYDPMIYGTGFLKIDIDDNTDELFMERVHPDEIIVDQRECVSGEMPVCMVQRKLVSKVWLLHTFGSDPEVRKKILEAQGKDWHYTSYRSPAEDQVVLVQAWKRPTSPGAGDGRMVLCIENCTLRDEPYDRDVFPFVFVKWADPESGFYGRSMVSDIMGYQINQNEMNELFRHGRDLNCVPRIFVEQGSDVQIHHIDNSVAKFIRYRGTKPESVTWPAFNPEMYQERERNRSNCYEYIGLSQATAQASAPTDATRFDSSKALQEFSGVQDKRLIRPAMKLERAYLEAARHIIELSAKLHKKGKTRKVTFMQNDLVQEIPWSQVNLTEDKYVLQIGAASVLSMTPAARTDTLERWLSEGKITLDDYHELSGQPDLERLADRKASQRDHFEKQVDRMLDGKPQTPTPFDNLEAGFDVVHAELMLLMAMDDAPAEIIDLFMQWLEIAKDMMAPEPDPMQQMANPAMQMAPGDPMAAAAGMTPGSMPPMDPSLDPAAALGAGGAVPGPGGFPA